MMESRMIEKVTSGSRWRGLESDLFSQWSGSASHRRRWTGPKDRCLGLSTAPALDPTPRLLRRRQGRQTDPEQHIEAPRPGYLFCQDTYYYVGTIKGVGINQAA